MLEPCGLFGRPHLLVWCCKSWRSVSRGYHGQVGPPARCVILVDTDLGLAWTTGSPMHRPRSTGPSQLAARSRHCCKREHTCRLATSRSQARLRDPLTSTNKVSSQVTCPTRTHWSMPPQQNSPSLSGDHWKPAMGCVLSSCVQRCCTLPATPSACPSASCRTLWSGYLYLQLKRCTSQCSISGKLSDASDAPGHRLAKQVKWIRHWLPQESQS